MASFGSMFKRLRIEQGLTLRRFCEAHGFDPGNISRIERGVFPPPESPEKLEGYAKALGLKRRTERWMEFHDLAAAERGQIPTDLLKDEAVVSRLPLFFRTLRGQKNTRTQMKELVEIMRQSNTYGS